jgi:hypothetical protein
LYDTNPFRIQKEVLERYISGRVSQWEDGTPISFKTTFKTASRGTKEPEVQENKHQNPKYVSIFDVWC